MNSVKCFNCGLTNFSSTTNCKRCGKELAANQSTSKEYAPVNFSNGQDVKSEVQSKQSIIYMIGFSISLFAALVGAFNAEDSILMIALLICPLVIGFLLTWVIASRVENSATNGKGLRQYGVTVPERITVFVISLTVAFVLLKQPLGYILSPLMIIVFNSALFLYGRKGNKN